MNRDAVSSALKKKNKPKQPKTPFYITTWGRRTVSRFMQEQKSHHTVVLAREDAQTLSGVSGQRPGGGCTVAKLWALFSIIRCVKMKTWRSSYTESLRVITGWSLQAILRGSHLRAAWKSVNGLGFWRVENDPVFKCVKVGLHSTRLGLRPVKSLYKV